MADRELLVSVILVALFLNTFVIECIAGDDGLLTPCVNYDGDVECSSMAELGKCQTNPVYMVTRCRLACRACVEFGCVDEEVYGVCQSIANTLVCTLVPDYMACHCRQFCGLCLSSTNSVQCSNVTSAEPQPGGDTCVNLYDSTRCMLLSEQGYCVDSDAKHFMETQCAKSCKICSSFNDTREPPHSTTNPQVTQQSTGATVRTKAVPSEHSGDFHFTLPQRSVSNQSISTDSTVTSTSTAPLFNQTLAPLNTSSRSTIQKFTSSSGTSSKSLIAHANLTTPMKYLQNDTVYNQTFASYDFTLKSVPVAVISQSTAVFERTINDSQDNTHTQTVSQSVTQSATHPAFTDDTPVNETHVSDSANRDEVSSASSLPHSSRPTIFPSTSESLLVDNSRTPPMLSRKSPEVASSSADHLGSYSSEISKLSIVTARMNIEQDTSKNTESQTIESTMNSSVITVTSTAVVAHTSNLGSSKGDYVSITSTEFDDLTVTVKTMQSMVNDGINHSGIAASSTESHELSTKVMQQSTSGSGHQMTFKNVDNNDIDTTVDTNSTTTSDHSVQFVGRTYNITNMDMTSTAVYVKSTGTPARNVSLQHDIPGNSTPNNLLSALTATTVLPPVVSSSAVQHDTQPNNFSSVITVDVPENAMTSHQNSNSMASSMTLYDMFSAEVMDYTSAPTNSVKTLIDTTSEQYTVNRTTSQQSNSAMEKYTYGSSTEELMGTTIAHIHSSERTVTVSTSQSSVSGNYNGPTVLTSSVGDVASSTLYQYSKSIEELSSQNMNRGYSTDKLANSNEPMTHAYGTTLDRSSSSSENVLLSESTEKSVSKSAEKPIIFSTISDYGSSTAVVSVHNTTSYNISSSIQPLSSNTNAPYRNSSEHRLSKSSESEVNSTAVEFVGYSITPQYNRLSGESMSSSIGVPYQTELINSSSKLPNVSASEKGLNSTTSSLDISLTQSVFSTSTMPENNDSQLGYFSSSTTVQYNGSSSGPIDHPVASNSSNSSEESTSSTQEALYSNSLEPLISITTVHFSSSTTTVLASYNTTDRDNASSSEPLGFSTTDVPSSSTSELFSSEVIAEKNVLSSQLPNSSTTYHYSNSAPVSVSQSTTAQSTASSEKYLTSSTIDSHVNSVENLADSTTTFEFEKSSVELLGSSNATELLGSSIATELLGSSNATELLGSSIATHNRSSMSALFGFSTSTLNMSEEERVTSPSITFTVNESLGHATASQNSKSSGKLSSSDSFTSPINPTNQPASYIPNVQYSMSQAGLFSNSTYTASNSAAARPVSTSTFLQYNQSSADSQSFSTTASSSTSVSEFNNSSIIPMSNTNETVEQSLIFVTNTSYINATEAIVTYNTNTKQNTFSEELSRSTSTVSSSMMSQLDYSTTTPQTYELSERPLSSHVTHLNINVTEALVTYSKATQFSKSSVELHGIDATTQSSISMEKYSTTLGSDVSLEDHLGSGTSNPYINATERIPSNSRTLEYENSFTESVSSNGTEYDSSGSTLVSHISGSQNNLSSTNTVISMATNSVVHTTEILDDNLTTPPSYLSGERLISASASANTVDSNATNELVNSSTTPQYHKSTEESSSSSLTISNGFTSETLVTGGATSRYNESTEKSLNSYTNTAYTNSTEELVGYSTTLLSLTSNVPYIISTKELVESSTTSQFNGSSEESVSSNVTLLYNSITQNLASYITIPSQNNSSSERSSSTASFLYNPTHDSSGSESHFQYNTSASDPMSNSVTPRLHSSSIEVIDISPSSTSVTSESSDKTQIINANFTFDLNNETADTTRPPISSDVTSYSINSSTQSSTPASPVAQESVTVFQMNPSTTSSVSLGYNTSVTLKANETTFTSASNADRNLDHISSVTSNVSISHTTTLVDDDLTSSTVRHSEYVTLPTEYATGATNIAHASQVPSRSSESMSLTTAMNNARLIRLFSAQHVRQCVIFPLVLQSLQALLIALDIRYQNVLSVEASFTGQSTSSLLYVSNDTDVMSVNASDGTFTSLVHQPNGNIVSLGLDNDLGLLFWVNNGRQWRCLYRVYFNGSDFRCIVSTDILEVNGMAIDQSSRYIFWTDAQRRRIEMTDYEGLYRRVVIYQDLLAPRGIIVDHVGGWLYWNDQGTKRIERSRLDGSDRQLLVSGNVTWPNQMSIMYTANTSALYWLDAWDQSLNSISLSDVSRNVNKMSLRSVLQSRVTFGLAIPQTGDGQPTVAYISVWNSGTLLQVDLTTATHRVVSSRLSDDVLFNIAYDLTSDVYVSSPCSYNSMHVNGCSHICLTLGWANYRCACPTFGARVLSNDGKTCLIPDQFLLYADSLYGHVGFIDVNPNKLFSNDLHLIAYSERPVGVAYDPLTENVYWSDVKQRAIMMSSLTSTNRNAVIAVDQGLGYVEGLCMDFTSRRLYFTNEDSAIIDGVTYSWRRIEVIGLDGHNRRVIVNEGLQLPRGLWIDAHAGFLYYTDWGEDAKVVRSYLDGSHPTVLKRGLVNPNGVTVTDSGIVLIVDSRVKDKNATSAVYVSNDGGVLWTEVDQILLQAPFGIASDGTEVYISDWYNGTIGRYDLVDKTLVPMTSIKLGQPAAVVFCQRTLPVNGTDRTYTGCDSANCSDICLSSVNSSVSCSCPSDAINVLSDDTKSCINPRSFILLADMNSIDMIGYKSTNDRSRYTAVYGQFYNSYTAVVYDVHNDVIYYSDVNRMVILKTSLSPYDHHHSDVTVVYAAHDVIEDLVLDQEARCLYWTAYKSGLIARLELGISNATHDVIVSSVTSPRGLTVDNYRGYLYWSQVNDSHGLVMRSNLNGSALSVVTSQVQRPNAIHLDSALQNLFILDGSATCQLSALLPGIGPFFGLSVYDNAVYYTDWGNSSLVQLTLGSRDVRYLLTGLQRPTRFVLHVAMDTMQTDGSIYSSSSATVAFPMTSLTSLHETTTVSSFPSTQQSGTVMTSSQQQQVANTSQLYSDSSIGTITDGQQSMAETMTSSMPFFSGSEATLKERDDASSTVTVAYNNYSLSTDYLTIPANASLIELSNSTMSPVIPQTPTVDESTNVFQLSTALSPVSPYSIAGNFSETVTTTTMEQFSLSQHQNDDTSTTMTPFNGIPSTDINASHLTTLESKVAGIFTTTSTLVSSSSLNSVIPGVEVISTIGTVSIEAPLTSQTEGITSLSRLPPDDMEQSMTFSTREETLSATVTATVSFLSDYVTSDVNSSMTSHDTESLTLSTPQQPPTTYYSQSSVPSSNVVISGSADAAQSSEVVASTTTSATESVMTSSASTTNMVNSSQTAVVDAGTDLATVSAAFGSSATAGVTMTTTSEIETQSTPSSVTMTSSGDAMFFTSAAAMSDSSSSMSFDVVSSVTPRSVEAASGGLSSSSQSTMFVLPTEAPPGGSYGTTIINDGNETEVPQENSSDLRTSSFSNTATTRGTVTVAPAITVSAIMTSPAAETTLTYQTHSSGDGLTSATPSSSPLFLDATWTAASLSPMTSTESSSSTHEAPSSSATYEFFTHVESTAHLTQSSSSSLTPTVATVRHYDVNLTSSAANLVTKSSIQEVTSHVTTNAPSTLLAATNLSGLVTVATQGITSSPVVTPLTSFLTTSTIGNRPSSPITVVGVVTSRRAIESTSTQPGTRTIVTSQSSVASSTLPTLMLSTVASRGVSPSTKDAIRFQQSSTAAVAAVTNPTRTTLLKEIMTSTLGQSQAPISPFVTSTPPVQESKPPRFTYCPSNIRVTTNQPSVAVWWRDPVVDRSQIETSLSTSASPGGSFRTGITEVIYRAVNSRGLTSICQFSVNVQTIGYRCADLPRPINGEMSCSQTGGGENPAQYSCTMTCNAGYVPYIKADLSVHVCNVTDNVATWSPPFSSSADSYVCLESTAPVQISMTTIVFNGSCILDATSQNQFLESLSNTLNAEGACLTTPSIRVSSASRTLVDVCDASNYFISCSTSSSSGQPRLRRRETNPMIITIMLQLLTSEKSVQSAITDSVMTVQRLISTKLLLVTISSGGVFMATSGNTVVSSSTSCPTYWQTAHSNNQTTCVACTDGFYYSLVDQTCLLCAGGSYQPLSSRINCLSCPQSMTSPPGSLNVAQCTIVPTTVGPSSQTPSSPSSSDQRVAIIVGVCVGVGILLIVAVVLIVILVCVLHRRHSRNISGQRRHRVRHGRTRVRGHYDKTGNGRTTDRRLDVSSGQLNYAWTEGDKRNSETGDEDQENAAIMDLSRQSHVTVRVPEQDDGRFPTRVVNMATVTPHVIRYVVTPPTASSSRTWPPSGMPERTKTRLERHSMSMSQLSRPFSAAVDQQHSLRRPVAGRAYIVRPNNHINDQISKNLLRGMTVPLNLQSGSSDLFTVFQQSINNREGDQTMSAGQFRRLPATSSDIQLAPMTNRPSGSRPQSTGALQSVTIEHHQTDAGNSPLEGSGFFNRGYSSSGGVQYPMAVVKPTLSDAVRPSSGRPVAAGRRKSRGSPPLQVRQPASANGEQYREQTTLI